MAEYNDSFPRPTQPQQPSVDPTSNVKDLVREASIRFEALRKTDLKNIEKLRHADSRTHDAEMRRIKDLMDMRSAYTEKLEVAEAKRIDAIRLVDVNAVAIANERATAQAAVLANQVASSAETLRILVAQTAATTKLQLDQTTQQLSDRLASLEKLQYEGKGLSGTVPPAVSDRLAQLEESKFRGEGRAGLSAPLMMLLAGLGGGILVFIIEQFMR